MVKTLIFSILFLLNGFIINSVVSSVLIIRVKINDSKLGESLNGVHVSIKDELEIILNIITL